MSFSSHYSKLSILAESGKLVYMPLSFLVDAEQSTDLRMDAHLFVALLLALVWTSSAQSLRTQAAMKDFKCEHGVPGLPLNLTAMSGYWYEAGRAPKVNVLKCLNVSVPATVDVKLELKLEYISTISDEIRAVKETISFPWDELTKNSIFVLNYGDPSKLPISVTYKVVYTDPQLLTVLCGYSSMSPMPLVKILSRERQLNQEFRDNIQAKIDKAGMADYFIWTEQSPESCNAAVRPATEAATILAVLTLLWCLLQGNCR
ncbi:uncharacterized protein LOC115766098 [Drosophila novamexicana]|uniref:uncharacterized protein LOC115766098 n=1 Tax=Drosophila novamexicana TaxID=47314 RepID=UPI0011E5EF45|nr:uncharacterized protein LOC115766098 [Drosophila novamexicana]